MINIEVILSTKEQPGTAFIWEKLVAHDWFSQQGRLLLDGLTGDLIKASDVLDQLRKNEATGFRFELGSGAIGYTFISDLGFSRIDIEGLANSMSDAESWMDLILGEVAFVQARLYDAEYDRWQNAKDILIYESAHKSHEHLPKISNGLPFPLTRTIVDTSKNPGRWSLKYGYVEAVGAMMWLSTALIAELNSDLAALDGDKGFVVLSDRGYKKIVSLERCFKFSDGEEGAIQRKLRDCIFLQGD